MGDKTTPTRYHAKTVLGMFILVFHLISVYYSLAEAAKRTNLPSFGENSSQSYVFCVCVLAVSALILLGGLSTGRVRPDIEWCLFEE